MPAGIASAMTVDADALVPFDIVDCADSIPALQKLANG